MTLPASGTISLSQVNTELGVASNTLIGLNQSNVRTLAGKPSGTISMSDLHGKPIVVTGQAQYVTPGTYSWTVPANVTC